MKATVYYSCSFVPPELIEACGCEARRITAGCGNGRFSPIEGICSYTKAWLEALFKKSESEDFTAVFTTSCDQMRRAFDLYGRPSGRKAFLLNVPATDSPQALDYYSDELQRLAALLCSSSGNKFDLDRLRRLMLSRVMTDNNPKDIGGPGIAFVGGPVGASIRQAAAEILSAVNGRIIFDASEDTLIDRYLKFDPDRAKREPMKELAACYFRLPAVWKRPNQWFYDWFIQKVRDNKIDGIILFRHVFCDVWHSQVYTFKHRFGIPVLDIELDGREVLSACALSRIQAFLETFTA